MLSRDTKSLRVSIHKLLASGSFATGRIPMKKFGLTVFDTWRLFEKVHPAVQPSCATTREARDALRCFVL